MALKKQITTEPELDIKWHLSEAKRLIDEALRLLANQEKVGSKAAVKASPPKAKKMKKTG
jgi:hypothetical protein